MLLIRVISFKGQPVSGEIAAQFREAGGTIGRAEHSTLVLPDPERYISRTHATISFQAGGFIITDNGTKNPVLLNGRALGAGVQGRLGSGDRIKLGDYVLEVVLTAPPSESRGAGGARVSAPTKDDPFAGLGSLASPDNDPFADLLRSPDRPTPATETPLPTGVDAGLPRSSTRAPLPAAQLPADILDILRGPEPGIDQIYDLRPTARSELLSPEEPRALQESAGAFGLLDARARRPLHPPTVPDHGLEVFTPYAPPAAKPDRALESPDPPGPTVVPPPSPAAAPVLQPAINAPSEPGDPALLGAFLRGIGIGDPRIAALTPELMVLIGQLLREAVQGTVELLRARGLTKSEMRADITMITPRDTNPLKFSPSAEAAITHLLTPTIPGFLPPLRAMKGAYDDLRAHQVGFLAGMRAALDEVLASFAPAELEKRLSDASVLDSLLPINRKAKLWDLFVQRYGDVAGEAREDFNAAFGKAFRRAYDAQVKTLRTEGI